MPFILHRLDDGKDSWLAGWSDGQSAWSEDQARAWRFASALEALDAAVIFDQPHLDHLGPITIAECD